MSSFPTIGIFWDKVVNRIFELENTKLTTYKGNYEKMAAQKAQVRLTMEREYANKEKEIKRLQGIVEQQKQWGQIQKNLVTAHSKEKVIARIEATMEKAPNDPKTDRVPLLWGRGARIRRRRPDAERDFESL